jgi:hypothetical protein
LRRQAARRARCLALWLGLRLCDAVRTGGVVGGGAAALAVALARPGLGG